MGKGKANLFFLDDALLGCGRRICGCLCCLMCLGPFLIIIGIIMFNLAAVDPRSRDIGTYNIAVDAWVASEYQNFESKQLVYSVYDQQMGYYRFMNNVTTADPINDSGDNIHSYSDYRRYVKQGRFVGELDYPSTSISIHSLVDNKIYTVPVQGYKTHVKYPHDLACTYSCKTSSGHSTDDECYDEETCATYCGSDNGYWSDATDTCYYINFVEDVCIKVGADGKINTNDAFCYPQTFGTDLADNQLGLLRSVPAFTVTVRSEKDPFITLYSLTSGVLSFGPTAGQYFKMGVGFMIVGALINLLVVVGITVLIKMGYCLCFGHKEHHHHHEHKSVQYSLIQNQV